MKITSMIIIMCLLTSCVSYKYEYQQKEDLNGIDVYQAPYKTKHYSIGTYISVIGLPLSSGYFLGNHVYDNERGVGVSIDSANNDKYAIYASGALVAGIWMYSLMKDTSMNKKNYIQSYKGVNEWYANSLDFDNNILLGYIRNNSSVDVYSVQEENIDNIYATSYKELNVLYNVLNSNPNKQRYLKLLADNSYDKIPKSEHDEVYNLIGELSPQYLISNIDSYRSYGEIRGFVDKIRKSNIPNKDEYYIKASKLYQTHIGFSDLKNITNWVWTFQNIDIEEINSTRKSIPEFKSKLAKKRKIEVLKSYQDKDISNYIDSEYNKCFNYFKQNENDKAKELSEIISSKWKKHADKRVIFENEVNSFKKDFKDLNINTKSLDSLLDQSMEYSKNEVDMINKKGIELKSLVEELIAKEEARIEAEKEEKRRERIDLLRSLKDGDCIIVGHDKDLLNSTNELGILGEAMGQAFINELGGKRELIYWYQGVVIKRGTRIGVRITLQKGIKTEFLGETWDKSNPKWRKDQIIGIDDNVYLKYCF